MVLLFIGHYSNTTVDEEFTIGESIMLTLLERAAIVVDVFLHNVNTRHTDLHFLYSFPSYTFSLRLFPHDLQPYFLSNS